jgi:putative Holliday junction resolvase
VRILAVDPGSKRVGIAVSDPSATIAQALPTVPAEPAATLASRLTEIAKAQDARRIVVGLPLRLDGRHGPEAKAAQELADRLRDESGLPVELVDERLTTAAAERSLIEGGVRREKRRLSIDGVAATLLLQGHLDRKNRG